MPAKSAFYAEPDWRFPALYSARLSSIDRIFCLAPNSPRLYTPRGSQAHYFFFGWAKVRCRVPLVPTQIPQLLTTIFRLLRERWPAERAAPIQAEPPDLAIFGSDILEGPEDPDHPGFLPARNVCCHCGLSSSSPVLPVRGVPAALAREQITRGRSLRLCRDSLHTGSRGNRGPCAGR